MALNQKYELEPDDTVSVVGGGGVGTNISIKYRNKTLPPVNLSLCNNCTFTFRGKQVEYLMLTQGVAGIYFGFISASLNGIFWWEKAPLGHLTGGYDQSIAAGANINLDSFTVANGLNGVLEKLTVELTNDSTAALTASFFVRLLYSQNGGASVPIFTARLPTGAPVGAVLSKIYGPKYMLPSDSFTLNVINNTSVALKIDWGVMAYSWVDY